MGELPARIVAATSSAHKLAELRGVAEGYGVRIVSPKDVAAELGLEALGEIAEHGESFDENAEIKARAVFDWCGLPAIGDDSGLEVEALGGRPGIYSARYAGPGASDADRIAKLLSELEKLEAGGEVVSRAARFWCSLCLVLPAGGCYRAHGELRGEVLRVPRGSDGFGYDPIIHLFDLNATLAEVEFSVTCSRGFRAKAAHALLGQFAKR